MSTGVGACRRRTRRAAAEIVVVVIQIIGAAVIIVVVVSRGQICIESVGRSCAGQACARTTNCSDGVEDTKHGGAAHGGDVAGDDALKEVAVFRAQLGRLSRGGVQHVELVIQWVDAVGNSHFGFHQWAKERDVVAKGTAFFDEEGRDVLELLPLELAGGNTELVCGFLEGGASALLALAGALGGFESVLADLFEGVAAALGFLFVGLFHFGDGIAITLHALRKGCDKVVEEAGTAVCTQVLGGTESGDDGLELSANGVGHAFGGESALREPGEGVVEDAGGLVGGVELAVVADCGAVNVFDDGRHRFHVGENLHTRTR
jgi:hypothetical protein